MLSSAPFVFFQVCNICWGIGALRSTMTSPKKQHPKQRTRERQHRKLQIVDRLEHRDQARRERVVGTSEKLSVSTSRPALHLAMTF